MAEQWKELSDISGSTIRTRSLRKEELAVLEMNPMLFVPGQGMVRINSNRTDGYLATPIDTDEGSLPLNPVFNNYLTRDMSGSSFYEWGYKRNSIIFGLINMRVIAIQQAPILLFDEKHPDKPVIDCPLAELLAYPNDLFDWSKTLAHTEGFQIMGGVSYWHKVRNAYGVVEKIFVYHSTNISPVSTATSWLDHYIYDNGAGFKMKIYPEDIIAFRGEQRDWVRPMNSPSALGALATEIDVDNERKMMDLTQLQNGAIPAVLVELGQKFNASGDNVPYTQAELDILNQRYQLRFGGRNRGKGMIAPPGTKAHILGFDPRKMQTNEASVLPETRACHDLGVPIQMTSLWSSRFSKTYANYAEARLSLYEDTISPRWLSIGSAITHGFKKEVFKGDSRKYKVIFDQSQVPALHTANSDRANNEFTGMTATLDEARLAQGRDSDKQYGSQYLWQLQSTAAPVGKSSDSDKESEERLRRYSKNGKNHFEIIEE